MKTTLSGIGGIECSIKEAQGDIVRHRDVISRRIETSDPSDALFLFNWVFVLDTDPWSVNRVVLTILAISLNLCQEALHA